MKEFSLIGVDGNAFSVMGYVSKAMKKVGYSREDIDGYMANAMNSDYTNLLYISLKMVDECNERLREG